MRRLGRVTSGAAKLLPTATFTVVPTSSSESRHPLSATPVMTSKRFMHHGPGDRKKRTNWKMCYPDIIREKDADMYHSYYPYLFNHGEEMSLYPKIPENPRDWQPGQLQTTYDAVREDKYDAFLKMREKFPELYEDTASWENPPPFGEYNQNYSVRFGMIGVKAFSTNEYDEFGNLLPLTAFWFPDNQIVAADNREKAHTDRVVVGATNVPVEFHKPHITAFYKRQRVPVKHVSTSFPVTPDAFAPVGTKLDVRHFKVGQEVDIQFMNTDYGFQGTMFRYGFDGGYVWLGDSRWQRRPGSMGSEGQSRIYPGHRQSGQMGAALEKNYGHPVYRIDYKNSLIYLKARIDADIGCYVRFVDTMNTMGKTTFNTARGFPPFPTFIPPEGEDVSKLPTEDCQLVSMPLYHTFRDEHHATAQITQSDIDDARAVKPAAQQAKAKGYNMQKFIEARKKYSKRVRANRKHSLKGIRTKMLEGQEATREAKRKRTQRVKK